MNSATFSELSIEPSYYSRPAPLFASRGTLRESIQGKGAAGNPRCDDRAGDVVEGVVAVGEPIRVVVGGDRESLERRHLQAGAHVLDVLPPDLVGEPVLVVRRRIELIEGAAVAVARVFVAGCVVELAGELDGSRSCQAFTQLPVSGPRRDVVGAQRAALHHHFDVVVEACRHLAGEACADGRLMQRPEDAAFTGQIPIAPVEDVGLE